MSTHFSEGPLTVGPNGIYNSDGEPIFATGSDGTVWWQSADDAHLFAAAPDLLKALKASNEKLQALLFVGDGHPLVRANLDAIAKAERQS